MSPQNNPRENYWFFNTNETNGPGAYQQMFKQNVAAIWSYPDGPRKLEGARPGDHVLAYVNNQGLRAIGRVVDGEVEAGTGVFLNARGEQKPSEFHLEVEWDVVVPVEEALSFAEARSMECELPVRCTFAKFKQIDQAKQLVEELHKIAG